MPRKFDMKKEGFESAGAGCGFAKIPRDLELKSKKGTGYWLYRLCSRAAIRSGKSRYYKYENDIIRGEWVGGLVGLKKIFGVKKTSQALDILGDLQTKGYITYTYNECTGFLSVHVIGLNQTNAYNKIYIDFAPSYDKEELTLLSRSDGTQYEFDFNKELVRVCEGVVQSAPYTKTHGETFEEHSYDWVTESNECEDGFVFAPENTGFFCFSKRLMEKRLNSIATGKGERLDEVEAIFDMFCMTVYRDFGNAFSWYCPCIFPNERCFTSYAKLAKRWGWQKTTVSRFFEKYTHLFCVTPINGCYGSIVFNLAYQVKGPRYLLTTEEATKCFREIIGDTSLNTHDIETTFTEIEIAMLVSTKSYIKKHFCRCTPVSSGSSSLYSFYIQAIILAHEHDLHPRDLLKALAELYNFSPCMREELLSVYEYSPGD